LPRIFKKDIILYAMREFETKDVGDVLLVYSSDEVRILKKEKYIDEEIEEEELFGEDNENTLLEEEGEEEVDINNL
jgi:hypothetical protein